MEIERRSLGSIPLIEVAGDLDHLTGDSFDAFLRAALDEADTVLIDFSRCSYIDSAGLSVLLAACRDLSPGGWLGIVGTSTNLLRLFEIVGLTSHPGVRLFEDYSALPKTLATRGN